jgi:hypothetical protein
VSIGPCPFCERRDSHAHHLPQNLGDPPFLSGEEEGDPVVEILGLRAMVKRLEAELIQRGADWPTIGRIERGEDD